MYFSRICRATTILVVLAIIPLGVLGEPTDSVLIQRYQEVLKQVDSDHDLRISIEEVENLLRLPVNLAKISESFEAALSVAVTPEQLKDYTEKEAMRIFNNSLRVEGRHYIELYEVERFLEQSLEPFDLKIASFFPELPRKPEEDTPALQAIGEWISIRKSFLDTEDIGRPAAVTWSHLGEGDETKEPDASRNNYEIRGAVTVQPERLLGRTTLGGWRLIGQPVLVWEADVASAKSRADTSVTHRLGGQGAFISENLDRKISGHNVSLTFDYVTDKDYAADTVGGTVQWTPNAIPLGIGGGKTIASICETSLGFLWRPYLAFTFGDVQDSGGDEELEELGDYADFVGRVAGELYFSRFRFVPELRVSQELANGQDTHFFYSVAVRYSFDEKDRVSLELSYEDGRNSPKYLNVEVVQFGLGVKF